MAQQMLDAQRIEEIFADGVDLSDAFVVLSLANIAVERVRNADTSALSDVERRYFVDGVEELRNQSDAAAVNAAAELEAAGHQRQDGFFTTASWLRHHLGVSRSESRVRMQVVRMFEALPAWEQAARWGQVGPEHVRAAARTFALANARGAFVEHAHELLEDAKTVGFERFEELLANLRALADPERERRAAEARHEARHLSMRRQRDGSWRLSARFGDVQGAEINDVLAHFNDAEWRTDWNEATERLSEGADVRVDALRRTEPQRRADALHQAVLAAAAAPGDGRQPLPTLNVLIDWETFTTELEGGTHDPGRYRDVTCRTQDGTPLPIAEASTMALYAHLRRVVLDSAGTVIDLGRRSRLFTGAARDAVMLTHTTCIWFGCDAPIRRSQADHHVEWLRQQGRTSPHNGGPMCDAHNLLKARRRYSVLRDEHGDYTITRPDGTAL